MEKLDLTLDLSSRKTDIHYQAGTLYTTSPKFFMKYYLCNEVDECGLYLSSRALPVQKEDARQETNVLADEQDRDIFVPTVTAQEAVDKYKTALKVIDIEEVRKSIDDGQILRKIGEDVINFDIGSLTAMGILWLFSDKSLSYTAWIAALALLCNVNVYEAYRIARAYLISPENRQALENEVWHMGLSDMFNNPVKREDLKLYMKVRDGNFKFK